MGYVHSNRGPWHKQLISWLIPFIISFCLIACSGGGGSNPGGVDGDPSFTGVGVSLGPVGGHADAPEGVVGSAPEAVGLPTFTTLYMAWGGEDPTFDRNARKGIVFNVRSLDGPEGALTEDVDFRFHHENTYDKGTEPNPMPPFCQQETEPNGQIHITCEGPFNAVNGLSVRLVICGKPDFNIVSAHTRADQNFYQRLNDFIVRAWIKGDTSLWDLDVCPDRRYVDYVFYGSKAQLNFPLKAGEVNLVTFLPRDYADKMETYGPPNPNYLGHHTTAFPTSRQMNEYLYNAAIERAVIPFNHQLVRQDSELANILPGDSINMNFGSVDSGTNNIGAGSGNVPDNAYCQDVKSWDPERVKMETQAVELLNEVRAKGGSCGAQGTFSPAPALKMNPTLRCAARKHSKDMFDEDFFSHTNPKGQVEFQRIFQAGIQADPGGAYNQGNVIFTETGENIAMGFSSLNEALEIFLDSDLHCANIFNPNFTEIGAGFHPGGEKGQLLTLDFGDP